MLPLFKDEEDDQDRRPSLSLESTRGRGTGEDFGAQEKGGRRRGDQGRGQRRTVGGGGRGERGDGCRRGETGEAPATALAPNTGALSRERARVSSPT